MLKKVVVIAAAGLLACGAAWAKDVPSNALECKQLIDVTQMGVAAMSVGPKTTEEVMQLMKQLNDQCANGSYEEATRTANTVRGLVTKE